MAVCEFAAESTGHCSGFHVDVVAGVPIRPPDSFDDFARSGIDSAATRGLSLTGGIQVLDSA